MFERSKSTGRIEFYSTTRGFGFLNDMVDGTRRFFHISHVTSGVPEVGRIVTYEPAENAKGKSALNVEVVL